METERKIEKLLRAYARKRRAEAGEPLTLHPANRRTLLDEATRRAPASDKGGKGSLFVPLLAVFRRRLAFALCIVAIAFLGASMLLPALSSAKRKAQSLGAVNNLKQIGMATRQFAEDNKDVLPASLNQVTNVLGSERALFDPATGKPFVYAGTGKKLDDLQSNTVLAYSPGDEKSHAVLFADGRVETVSRSRFAELTNQKTLELAKNDKLGNAMQLETPAASAPAPTAIPAVPPPDLGAKGGLAEKESKTGNLALRAGSGGTSTGRRDELAASEPKSAGPVTNSLPTRMVGEDFAARLQPTTSVAGAASERIPTLTESAAVARNRSFNRLVETNALRLTLAASQNFVQAGVSGLQNYFRNSIASARKTPVLQSFQFQQNGNAISVVDRDGSVYDGVVRPERTTVRNEPAAADTFAPPGALPQTAGKAGQAVQNQQQTGGNYFFRVAGTNRTLKQNVVFTGNFLANNGSPQAGQSNNGFGAVGGGGGAAGNELPQAAANNAKQSSQANGYIVGTAVIADTNEVEINAVPVAQ